MRKITEFAEQHPAAVEIAAGAMLLVVIGLYADIRNWTKAVRQVAASEYIGG